MICAHVGSCSLSWGWSFVCTVVMCPSAGSGSQTACQSHDRNIRRFSHSGFRRRPAVIKAVIQRNLLLTLMKHLVSDVSTSLTSVADFIMCLENHLRLIWKHAFLIVRWEILIIPKSYRKTSERATRQITSHNALLHYACVRARFNFSLSTSNEGSPVLTGSMRSIQPRVSGEKHT